MPIATGSPPAVHGISGNFYLDRDTGAAVVMTGPELLRSRTILAEFSRHGATVVSITAKDKLRKQLGKDMDLAAGSVNFSSECADQTTLEEHGIENVLELVGMELPDIYSPELSLFVLEAGIRLLERSGPDLLYLSLTDYIQHKYAPGEPEADRYYRNLDACFGRLDALGAVVALTADHGMHDKSNPDGSPRVIWLQDVLDARRHLRGEGAVHPEPAAPCGVRRAGGGRAAPKLADLRLRHQRGRMRRQRIDYAFRRSSSASRLTSPASTWPLCVFMMSPTRRPTCLGSVMASAVMRSRTSARSAVSSSPRGR